MVKMISKVAGLCRVCNEKHYLPIHGTELKKENLKFTIHNTICDLCLEKVDLFSINKLNKKNNCPMLRRKRKIILVDASTNTEKNPSNESKKATFTNVPETRTKKSSSNINCQQPDGKPQRSLVCEFCRKTFTHSGDLNKHRRKHTGERPYNCSICNRKFSHASNLTRHQRLHSGEKPFACPLKCGRRFSRKDKLTEHVFNYHK